MLVCGDHVFYTVSYFTQSPMGDRCLHLWGQFVACRMQRSVAVFMTVDHQVRTCR